LFDDDEERNMLEKWVKLGQTFNLTEGRHPVARGTIIDLL
jgi:hypothetical protein